ncbi:MULTISPECIES: hypothetical protein [Streptomyces]|uniref:Uncharacterized protein n=1 Tax=Streptomyces achmelvichensis TaxID=3134111 RepID=A0ACC6PZH5_9ACTN|nr:hypothetical protein OG317_22565 [Streptomyces sp. NBC_01167]
MTNNGGRSNEPTGDGFGPRRAWWLRISGPAEGRAAREGDGLFARAAGHPKIQGL